MPWFARYSVLRCAAVQFGPYHNVSQVHKSGASHQIVSEYEAEHAWLKEAQDKREQERDRREVEQQGLLVQREIIAGRGMTKLPNCAEDGRSRCGGTWGWAAFRDTGPDPQQRPCQSIVEYGKFWGLSVWDSAFRRWLSG